MPRRDPERQREYARRHYEANKPAMKARARAHTDRVRLETTAYIRELKDGQACADCGECWRHWQLHFDHVRGEKLLDVAAMPWQGFSLAAIQAEIAKCEIVCANCHATRTYERRAAAKIASGR